MAHALVVIKTQKLKDLLLSVYGEMGVNTELKAWRSLLRQRHLGRKRERTNHVSVTKTTSEATWSRKHN